MHFYSPLDGMLFLGKTTTAITTTTTRTTKCHGRTFIFTRGVQNGLNCFSGFSKIFLKTKVNGKEIGY